MIYFKDFEVEVNEYSYYSWYYNSYEVFILTLKGSQKSGRAHFSFIVPSELTENSRNFNWKINFDDI